MGTDVASPQGHLVLHADVDAFFCQVEALRRTNESLQGVPLAVQQHQDIISVDYAARQAGVRKHMAPSEARRLLAMVGGRVVHVYCEDGTRPSYRPYREMSAALMRLLRRLLPPTAVLEVASIDEAYVRLPAAVAAAVGPASRQGALLPGAVKSAASDVEPLAGASGLAAGLAVAAAAGAEKPAAAAAAADADPWVHGAWRLAEDIRRQAREVLGLRVSVGVAANKLLAKLASRAAKPDGLLVLAAGSREVEDLLRETPVARLPGVGGRVADAMTAAGYDTVAQLRPLSPAALASWFGLRPAAAALVARWAVGDDPRVVQERGPPNAIQVQMTLTPVPRPAPWSAASAWAVDGATVNGATVNGATVNAMPASSTGGLSSRVPQQAAEAADGAGAGGRGGGPPPRGGPSAASAASGGPPPPLLVPLLVGTAEGWSRLRRLVRSMAGDLVARVLLDRHLERRWPAKLTVQLVTHGSSGRTAAKTCAFPAAALAPPAGELVTGNPGPSSEAYRAVNAGHAHAHGHNRKEPVGALGKRRRLSSDSPSPDVLSSEELSGHGLVSEGGAAARAGTGHHGSPGTGGGGGGSGYGGSAGAGAAAAAGTAAHTTLLAVRGPVSEKGAGFSAWGAPTRTSTETRSTSAVGPGGQVGAAVAATAATVATATAVFAAAAAAAVPRGGGGSQLVVGEHSFFDQGSSSALVEAVVGNALGLCGAILSAGRQGLPLVQVHLTAHSFLPYSAAAAAPSLSPFLAKRPRLDAAQTPLAAAAVAAASAAPVGAVPLPPHSVSGASPACLQLGSLGAALPGPRGVQAPSPSPAPSPASALVPAPTPAPPGRPTPPGPATRPRPPEPPGAVAGAKRHAPDPEPDPDPDSSPEREAGGCIGSGADLAAGAGAGAGDAVAGGAVAPNGGCCASAAPQPQQPPPHQQHPQPHDQLHPLSRNPPRPQQQPQPPARAVLAPDQRGAALNGQVAPRPPLLTAPHPPRPAASRGRSRGLPAPVSLLGLLASLWPEAAAGSGYGGPGGPEAAGRLAMAGVGHGIGAGDAGWDPEVAAAAAMQHMDAWLGVFEAEPLKGWWEGLGTDGVRGGRTAGGSSGGGA